MRSAAAQRTVEQRAPRAPESVESVPGHLRLLHSTMAVQLSHREKISAGVPGCTCGRQYPEDSHSRHALLQAHHVSNEVIRHVLEAAITAINEDRAAYENDPSQWTGSHDSAAAIDTITSLARPPAGPGPTKETLTS